MSSGCGSDHRSGGGSYKEKTPESGTGCVNAMYKVITGILDCYCPGVDR